LRLVKAELKLVLIFGTGSRTRTSSKSRIGILFSNSKIGTVFLVLFICGTKTGIEFFGEKITTIIRVHCWIQFKLPRTGLEKLKWILKILF